MIGTSSEERLTWIDAAGATRDDFARAVRDGLTRVPKRLPCRYLYDERGSELFERICDLPEYYLTRVEAELLEAHAEGSSRPSSTKLPLQAASLAAISHSHSVGSRAPAHRA